LPDANAFRRGSHAEQRSRRARPGALNQSRAATATLLRQ
jgi:hypothetical protein